jgi:hypothetical protein
MWISARFDAFTALLWSSEDLRNMQCRVVNGDPTFRKRLLSTFSRWSEKRTSRWRWRAIPKPRTLHQSIRCHIPIVFSHLVDLCSAL